MWSIAHPVCFSQEISTKFTTRALRRIRNKAAGCRRIISRFFTSPEPSWFDLPFLVPRLLSFQYYLRLPGKDHWWVPRLSLWYLPSLCEAYPLYMILSTCFHGTLPFLKSLFNPGELSQPWHLFKRCEPKKIQRIVGITGCDIPTWYYYYNNELLL